MAACSHPRVARTVDRFCPDCGAKVTLDARQDAHRAPGTADGDMRYGGAVPALPSTDDEP
jgi:hypothetical protein